MGKASRRKRDKSRIIERTASGRTIRMNDEMLDLFKRQRQRFIAKFGREPGPDDPVFFEPGKHKPEPVSEATSDAAWRQITDAMGSVGVDPAIIYATKKTGRIVTEENIHLLSKADLKEWYEAVESYSRAHGRGASA